jgi:hypothetical protein
MIKEYEIVVNPIGKTPFDVMPESLKNFSMAGLIIVTAEVIESKERVEIELIAINGKDIVSIDQCFEDEIKDMIVKELSND